MPRHDAQTSPPGPHDCAARRDPSVNPFPCAPRLGERGIETSESHGRGYLPRANPSEDQDPLV